MSNLTSSHVNSQGVTIEVFESDGTYVGKGEFYSGLKTGDSVHLTETVYTHSNGHSSRSMSVSAGGASLAIYDRTLVV